MLTQGERDSEMEGLQLRQDYHSFAPRRHRNFAWCAGQEQPAGEAAPTMQGERDSEMEGVRLRRWAVGAALPMDEDWQPAPGKWALSEREMEMIDLGKKASGISFDRLQSWWLRFVDDIRTSGSCVHLLRL